MHCIIHPDLVQSEAAGYKLAKTVIWGKLYLSNLPFLHQAPTFTMREAPALTLCLDI